ncbi:hypothetical protein NHX12_002188 [Muraenolepis orangiensis]|uniref:Uncharacterized protein n=1 Tax=Muraenolepis orangiensis TaxID=630683 RepID=A0A9Q0E404_9TELE|nr:hypothetical protein NHX12_002188 [Muraenolepis orangiensis]
MAERACREVFIIRLLSSENVPSDKRLELRWCQNPSCSAKPHVTHLRAVTRLAKFLHHGSVTEITDSTDIELNTIPSAEISPSDLCTESQRYNGGGIHIVLHFERGSGYMASDSLSGYCSPAPPLPPPPPSPNVSLKTGSSRRLQVQLPTARRVLIRARTINTAVVESMEPGPRTYRRKCAVFRNMKPVAFLGSFPTGSTAPSWADAPHPSAPTPRIHPPRRRRSGLPIWRTRHGEKREKKLEPDGV